MAKIDLIVTLVSIGFDKYNSIDSGHFSAALPPSCFPAAVARGILEKQAMPHILNVGGYSISLENFSCDARGYAFSIFAKISEFKEALSKLTVGESITVPIEIETPDDFGA